MIKALINISLTNAIFCTCEEDPVFSKEVSQMIGRFKKKDWGDDLSEVDRKANDEANFDNFDRVLAAYNSCHGRVYIVSYVDMDTNDEYFVRTIVMFDDEY